MLHHIMDPESTMRLPDHIQINHSEVQLPPHVQVTDRESEIKAEKAILHT